MRRTALMILVSLWTSISFCQTPTNVTCDNALEIACGDLVSGTTDGVSSEFLSTNCFFVYDQILWYKLVGDGSVNVLSYISSNTSAIEIIIISGDCDAEEAVNCRGQYYLYSTNDSIRIQTLPNEEIYIAINQGCCEDVGEFEFMRKCQIHRLSRLYRNFFSKRIKRTIRQHM
jgi:hypothetical protein